MLSKIFKYIFPSNNDRIVKSYEKIVHEINELEKNFINLTDEQLRGKTNEFRARLQEAETLDFILPEAFATVREAAKRVMGQRHYDVQMIGGIALHKGMVAEMKTGEGKTLVATLSVYLNALEGKGVHVVTVNDYLARRDAEWMGKIYTFLDLTVGIITNDLTENERRQAYACDITYATNNELGFDYLRDNMRYKSSELVQREFNYAIVDEVDSILIDEARTPLIISGAADDNIALYKKVNTLIYDLIPEDYEIDEKTKNVLFTDVGNEHIEKLLKNSGILNAGSLYDLQNVALVHHAKQALKAHYIFKRDVDYIVKDNKIIIIDEFTGRMMEGRRYSDGIHQAIEAKENVNIQRENQTLASITFQNFFRLYKKLSGMTGTAITEAQELSDIYKLDTLVVPTNLPVTRIDYDDEFYMSAEAKYKAIIELIKECQNNKRPVLVGTVSIEKSEHISELLKQAGVKHNVLNARYHEVEAQIIAEAGNPGAITIATNMAGRGTDIKLGGNLEARLQKDLFGIEDSTKRSQLEQKIKEEIARDEKIVKDAGGLCIIGTERHDSRRIDNQLRGRSGRQGDSGSSKFFLSIEDDMMRIFAHTGLNDMLQKLNPEGEVLSHPWFSKAIEKAQTTVEANNYEMRKHLLKFDDVMNDQRKVIYEQRKNLITQDVDITEDINDMYEEAVGDILLRHIPEGTHYEYWNHKLINDDIADLFGPHCYELSSYEEAAEDIQISMCASLLKEQILENIYQKEAEKYKKYDREIILHLQKCVLLKTIDKNWKEHLRDLDNLKRGINLRAYAQKDPLNEYKQEAFTAFEYMVKKTREDVVRILSFARLDNYASKEEVENAVFYDFSSSDFGNNFDSGEDESSLLENMSAEQLQEKLSQLLESLKMKNDFLKDKFEAFKSGKLLNDDEEGIDESQDGDISAAGIARIGEKGANTDENNIIEADFQDTHSNINAQENILKKATSTLKKGEKIVLEKEGAEKSTERKKEKVGKISEVGKEITKGNTKKENVKVRAQGVGKVVEHQKSVKKEQHAIENDSKPAAKSKISSAANKTTETKIDVKKSTVEKSETAKKIEKILKSNNAIKSPQKAEGEEAQEPKISNVVRNSPCPCGSELKYKHCCGKIISIDDIRKK